MISTLVYSTLEMDMAQFRNGYGSDSNPKLKGLADCRQRNVPASTQRPRSWLPRTRYDTNHQGWASEIPHQKDGWTIWTPKNDFKKNNGMFTTYQLVIRISLAHPQ